MAIPADQKVLWIWVIAIILGFGILLAVTAQCRLSCPGGRNRNRERDTFKPLLGGIAPPYYAITNYPNPAYTNLTIPLPLPLEDVLREAPGEKQSDCILTPGGECHLASGGMGVCDPYGEPVCYKKKI